VGAGLKRLGVLGTMVWDTIVGRDPAEPPLEEWGGIGYALAGLDAALPEGWAIVPLVKVGRDLAERAQVFLRGLARVGAGARFVEVPEPNPRVKLFYQSSERRCEGLRGGVPPWTWPELGPMVADLDALYVNFITGFEATLETMQALRHAFDRPLYGDLHSLSLGIRDDGMRQPRPLETPLAWLQCFDVTQVNEDEMGRLGQDPLALAARALEGGVRAVVVTLGARGAAYVASRPDAVFGTAPGGVARTALVAAEGEPIAGDPTGCGDVFGATLVAGLLGGLPLEPAIAAANRMARRNVSYRGATGLQHYLRGALAQVPTA
jgi:sugar/nucleoside kinase (ribokinase family)